MPRKADPKKGPLSDLSEAKSQEQLSLYAVMPRKADPKKGPPSDLSKAKSQEQPSLYAIANGWPNPLPRFLKKMNWNTDQWQQVRKHWLERPEDLSDRNWLLYSAAKEEEYKRAPRRAIERQKRLRSDEWMTAYLLAAGWGREGIADFLLVGIDYVDKLIRGIKNKAEADKQPGIVRWFLGL